ncbi:MAG TPA: GDP-mannose 4,6-dehydratase [Acidimicrobiales bacterium]|nr:GDP-mannose 4,6-dehydratase [Acidimicrobiales bacterium]
MRAFLTGASGFVGGHLAAHLTASGDEVSALDGHNDLLDREALREQLAAAAPEAIYHLAALTHVGRSWEDPAETMRVNVLGTLELLEAARTLGSPRVLLVSSAEVYGAGEGRELDEEAPLRPISPYAASKVSAEYLGLQAFLGRGLPVVRARPFNHVGPGQSDAFVVSALALRVVEAERAGGGEVRVGNLGAARDFTDVRDVVRAYRLLVTEGEAGGVYNVCSGRPRTIASLLEGLIARSPAEIRAVVDPALFRPVDIPLLSGSGKRLEALTGWRPEIDLERTLDDVLAAYREQEAG